MFGIGAASSYVGGRCPFAHAPMRPTPHENSDSPRARLSTCLPAAFQTETLLPSKRNSFSTTQSVRRDTPHAGSSHGTDSKTRRSFLELCLRDARRQSF